MAGRMVVSCGREWYDLRNTNISDNCRIPHIHGMLYIYGWYCYGDVVMKIDYWLNKVTHDYFDQPIQEILDERQPASIGKIFLVDLLEQKHPELFERWSRKVVNQCVYVAMNQKGYKTLSKRKRTFWREDTC